MLRGPNHPLPLNTKQLFLNLGPDNPDVFQIKSFPSLLFWTALRNWATLSLRSWPRLVALKLDAQGVKLPRSMR